MRVHVVALPHTDPTFDWSTCAYSQKVRRLGGMLTSMGHEVILYAGERSDAIVTEHVQVVTDADRRRWFGDETWRERVFDRWEPSDPAWVEMNAKAIEAIAARAQARDVVGIISGRCQQAITDAFPAMIGWEWGVGYAGVLPGTFRVFESHAWRAHVAGLAREDDFRAFDTVIPNSWEPTEFPALGAGDGGYLLFIGRVIRRKGPHVAAAAARALGMRLVVAGQGVSSVQPGRIRALDGTSIEGDVEYAGILGPEERAQVMGAAVATFVPTQYLEPFGGVAVESQMVGTPALVTPWGGLAENVRHGESGFLCSTLAEFVEAATAAGSLDRSAIRAHALATWSTEVIRHAYDAHLRRLDTLWADGWYQLKEAA
jgi:glycosyltransferase involved in cell wall biosynthesis